MGRSLNTIQQSILDKVANLVPLGVPYYFNGEIGEVMFMETILNANEVRHNFEATKMDYMQL